MKPREGDWSRSLARAAGFKPAGLPPQGWPFGSIPKPVSNFARHSERELE